MVILPANESVKIQCVFFFFVSLNNAKYHKVFKETITVKFVIESYLKNR